MGEYSREQRNQLSRVIANGGLQSKQLKAFVDNRCNFVIQQQKQSIYVRSSCSTDPVKGESGKPSIFNVSFPGVNTIFHYLRPDVEAKEAKEAKEAYVINTDYDKLTKNEQQKYYSTPRSAKQCAEPHALSNIWKRDLQLEEIKNETKDSWLSGLEFNETTVDGLIPCRVCEQWITNGKIQSPDKIELIGEIPKKEETTAAAEEEEEETTAAAKEESTAAAVDPFDGLSSEFGQNHKPGEIFRFKI